MIPLSIARIISCDLCSFSAHSPIFFQLIWILFHYSNPSVFCMMNRFYLPVIISFWNKYISRNWAQKAIFVTLGSILHTICLLLLTSKQISPSFSLWCFFFCLPLTAQCCWFAPFFFFAWLTATSVSASLGAAYISSLASWPQMCFFHQAKYACVGFAHTRCNLSLSHPSWYSHCQLCVTASLWIH